MGIFTGGGLMTSGLSAGDNYSETTYIYSGTSTTFIVPTGVSSLTFEAWAGGGKGGGGDGSPVVTIGYGGAGGGAYAKTTIAVIPGDSYSLSVGQGSSSYGGTGGTTSISSGVTIYCSANGAISCLYNVNGPTAGGRVDRCIGDVVYAGGNGDAGTNTSPPGVPGGSGGGAAGSTGAGAGGVGAPEFGGNGGAGGVYAHAGSVSNNGSAGSLYGGGGGGGSCYNDNICHGGNGANGLIRITYTTLL